MPLPDELNFATLTELGARLRDGQVTSLQLTRQALSRCESIGRQLNAVVTVLTDRALQEAEVADRELAAGRIRSPLHGIPYGVKDLLAARGSPTTWGAAPLREQEFETDATVVDRLHNGGAVLVAKLAMVELAGGLGYRQADASFTGPGRNPWNRERWAGGSSSGSAAAIAAGLVPFSIGSETWGSILTPAALCGVTGLRPTYGRVSRHGAMALSWTMDKVGPLARTAADCRVLFDVIAGVDPLDDSTVAPVNTPVTRKQPYTLVTLTGALDRAQPEVRRCFEDALEVLARFCEISESRLPGEAPCNVAADLIISAEAAAAFEPLVIDGRIEQLTAPEDRWQLVPDLMIPAKDYINALRLRRRVQLELQEWMAGFDAVVSPTLNTITGPVDQPFSDWARGFSSTPLSAAANLAGLPGVNLPCGFDDQGLPVGLSLTGAPFGDETLLAIGEEYQRRTDWHTRHPEA